MKNYEEMASSVLKRRDREIKRRRRAFLIGAPCAAAVLVGVVGIGATVAASNRGRVINPAVAKTSSDDLSDIIFQYYRTTLTDASNATAPAASESPDTMIADTTGTNNTASDAPAIAESTNVDLPTSATETANAIGIDIAIDDNPNPIDYTNPKSGQTEICIMYAALNIPEDNIELDESDFVEYSLESLDSFYGLRFNRLGQLYPSWKRSNDKLGIYRRVTNDGFIASCENYYTRNTLNYTTENGGKVSVSVQYAKFKPFVIGILPDKTEPAEPISTPELEVHIEYDENGNIIGMSTPAYAPTPNATAPDQNPNTDTPGASIINGYEAQVFGNLSKDASVDFDFFVADIEMSSRVRIIAEGLSEKEFLEVLDNFTR